MRAIHKLGYVSVFDSNRVFVYAEKDFPHECYFWDPDIDTEEWQSDEPGGK